MGVYQHSFAQSSESHQQGNNPGSEAGSTFSDWSLDTEYGNVLQIVKKNSESSLTRNGVNFETAALTISETSYYLLPEGYYGGLSEDGTALLVATNDDKTTADSLVSNLNAVSLEEITDELINNIREYDKNYMGMSDTLRYYVDASVDSGKTLASILESLGGQVSVSYTHLDVYKRQAQYRAAQKEMRELVTAKGNIDHLINLTGGRADKEQTR